jgi:hypothetical protein
MSSHPFSPQPFVGVDTHGETIHRHPDDPTAKVLLILAVFSAVLMGGFVYYLAGGTSESTQDLTENSETAQLAVQHGQPDGVPAAASETQVSKRDRVMGSLGPAGQDDKHAKRSLRDRDPDPDRPPLASGLPDLDDLQAWEAGWTDQLFESEAEITRRNPIDDHVFDHLAKLNLQPAGLCSDATFLRRAYLDTIGTLPTVQESRRFLSDRDPSKRAQLIDHLLQRPEFADYWAMKWSDILRVKAEFPINLWPNAAQAYHRWIRTSIRDNLAYDQFAYQLLTSSGSNFRAPQVNFYRAVQSQDPESIAKAVALTFLCERAEHWPAERLEGMSHFFSKIGYKPTGEWKEEIVFFDSRLGRDGEQDQEVVATFPNGVVVVVPADQDPRETFAKWLIDDRNPWFSRAICNRVWSWLMGRGIVEPADDVRSEHPPSNPELLDYLGDELVAANYDLRHIYRQILTSTAYQLACVPRDENPLADQHFAFYRTQRLDAEVLIDAICQITGTTETYMSIIPEPYTFLPEHQRAIALPDGSITSSFLELFGRPPRDTGLESERNNRLTAGQALHLVNSNHIRKKITEGPGIRDLLSDAGDATEAAELIYLAVLSRPPNEQECHVASQLCESTRGRHDLVWALINSDEFLFRH